MKNEKFEMPAKLMICLRKCPDQGKSETIKALAEILMQDIPLTKAKWYWPKQWLFAYKKKPEEMEKWSKKITEWPGDICVAVDVQGKRVGLCSHGDYLDVIHECLKFLQKQGCEIIFCACQTRGQTVNVIEKMAGKGGYTIIWTTPYTDNTPPGKKQLSPLQKYLNMKKAEHLSDFI